MSALASLNLVALFRLDLLGNLLLAAILGAAIGFERTLSGKSAGLRTTLLISLGSALLTDISMKLATHPGIDPLRMPAQIVSGLGFIAGGIIFQARGRVVGLTTAAGLWVAAAVGIAAGAGRYVEAIGTTVLVLAALAILGRAENHLLPHLTGHTPSPRIGEREPHGPSAPVSADAER